VSTAASAATAVAFVNPAGQLPALQIMLPMVAAPLAVLLRRPLGAWWIAMMGTVGSAFIAWRLLVHVNAEGPIRYVIGGWEGPTGIEFYIDALNATVLLLVAGISAVVLLYARESINRTVPVDKQYLFYAAWLLCLTGLLGITITGDAFNVFVFLEISSLATYMLIGLGQDRRALTASFNYLVLGSVGASFILIGVGFLYAATGTLNMIDLAHRIPDAESERAVLVAFSFLTIGLMIKAAVFPLHAWLANAYTHAPIAVTCFLAGTATKVSLYVMIRFFYSIFGADYSFGTLFLNSVLLPAGILGFVLMSTVAVFQTDLRRMLAYSSVAQLGYIVSGIALASQAGVSAALVHMVNHGLVKSTLFMAVGCILYRHAHVHIPSFDQLFKRMPATCTAFILAGLGLIGIPLTAGFVTKFQLVGAMLERDLWWVAGLVLASSLLALIYIARVVEVMLFSRSRAEAPTDGTATETVTRDEAPLSMLIPMYLLLAAMFWAGINGDATLAVAGEAARSVLEGLRVVPLALPSALDGGAS